MFENYKCPQELIPSDPRFGVGPSLVPVEYLQRLAETGTSLLGTSHRQSAVKNLVKEVQDGFRKYFNIPADYHVVLGNGGATLLWDMIGTGLVKNSSLHFTCGEFSQKWYKAHKNIPWIKAEEVAVDFGKGIEISEEKINSTDHDVICYTLNETSTGVQVANFPKVKDPNKLVCVDATSGAGQIYAPLEDIDMFYFSPQKVFAGEGGLFIAIMSPKAIKRALEIADDKSRYKPVIMDWKQAIENSEKNQTYNTPAVSNFFFINEQLKVMNAIGYQACVEEAKKKANLLYGWAQEKSYLSAYIEEEKYRSTAVACIDIDDKINAEDLTKSLKKQGVVFDIDAYRKLGRNQLRISMFHNVTYANLEKLTKLISHAIENA